MIVIRSPRLRASLRLLLPLAAIPLMVYLGTAVFPEKQHLLISFGVAALSALLFIAGYDRRQTGARRMVLTAVMTALCIAGRFIPFFKPVAALTMLTAVYLGPEAGFLTGALSALLSNFWFGQGPWTAFQMLAWGLTGLAAGYLAGPLQRRKWLMLLFGVAAGVVYSMVMDVWTVLWYGGGFSWQLYGAAFVTALPHTLLYAVSNFAFLLFMAEPIGRKLARIRLKYGL